MKKADVELGGTYTAKVSGRITQVRIISEHENGGWWARNVATKRGIRIKSAQRLRRCVSKPTPAKAKTATKTTAPMKALVTAAAAATPTAKTTTKATGKPKAAAKRDTGERGAKRAKRPSGLDAAAQILAKAGEPLGCREIVKRMLAQNLWQTNGQTPQATIYAAITREITAKGDAARFRKVARGRFELAK